MTKYDLFKILKEELGNGSKDLVTRQSGETIRRRIERDIEKEPDGAVISLGWALGDVDHVGDLVAALACPPAGVPQRPPGPQAPGQIPS